MQKYHIIVTILLAVNICIHVKSQTVIEGSVFDADDKQPVSNVLVKIVNPGSPGREIITYAKTNKAGEYNLQFKTGLTYIEMEFSLLGYKRDTVRIKSLVGILLLL